MPAGNVPKVVQPFLAEIISMSACGLSNRKIAKGLGLTKEAVGNAIKDALVFQRIQTLRSMLHAKVVGSVTEDLVPLGIDLIKDAAAKGDTKGWDSATRGLLNLTKAAAQSNPDPKPAPGQGDNVLTVNLNWQKNTNPNPYTYMSGNVKVVDHGHNEDGSKFVDAEDVKSLPASTEEKKP